LEYFKVRHFGKVNGYIWKLMNFLLKKVPIVAIFWTNFQQKNQKFYTFIIDPKKIIILVFYFKNLALAEKFSGIWRLSLKYSVKSRVFERKHREWQNKLKISCTCRKIFRYFEN
jgi:hypothetical protein